MAKGKKNLELRKGKSSITPIKKKPKAKKPRVVKQVIHTRPRFTGSANANANFGVQSRGPDTRMGWFLFLIVALVLIMIVPTMIVNSLSGASAQAVVNFGEWWNSTFIGQWASNVGTGFNNIIQDLLRQINGGG